MRQVILTVGPQGSGKTTFCREIVRLRPDVLMIERDALLTELFGDAWLDPYTGAHHYGYQVMMERVKDQLQTDSIILILDAWTGDANDRWHMTKRLREYGADHITAWYFVTGEDDVVRQFVKRSGLSLDNTVMRDIQACSCRHNYRIYHAQPVQIDQGFDEIELIDPHQLTLFPYADLLL